MAHLPCHDKVTIVIWKNWILNKKFVVYFRPNHFLSWWFLTLLLRFPTEMFPITLWSIFIEIWLFWWMVLPALTCTAWSSRDWVWADLTSNTCTWFQDVDWSINHTSSWTCNYSSIRTKCLVFLCVSFLQKQFIFSMLLCGLISYFRNTETYILSYNCYCLFIV